MKVVNYLVRMSIIIFVMAISRSSASVSVASVENDNINKTVNLTTMAMKVLEAENKEKYTPVATYTGSLTGYVYNCPLCNGTLGCMPKYNIKDGTTTYNDYEYGEVLIVASSSNLKCGSIVSFENSKIKDGKSYAIVLDRGVVGTALDLLSPSYEYAVSNVGRMTITYDVLRNGWE